MNDSQKPLPLDLNFDFPWPQKGDTLLTSNGDASYLVRTLAGEGWETYVSAYRMAAEALFDRTHDMTLSINWLVFPVVFLYRHYLELRLKSLAWDGNAMDGRPAERLDTIHSLEEL